MTLYREDQTNVPGRVSYHLEFLRQLVATNKPTGMHMGEQSIQQSALGMGCFRAPTYSYIAVVEGFKCWHFVMSQLMHTTVRANHVGNLQLHSCEYLARRSIHSEGWRYVLSLVQNVGKPRGFGL